MKTLLSVALFFTLAQAAGAETLHCKGKSGGFSVKLDTTQNISVQFSRDTYEGTYAVTSGSDGTRLAGDELVKMALGETNGCWPGSSFSANLVLRAPDFTSGFGSFTIIDAGGKELSAGAVECESEVPQKNDVGSD